MREEKTHFVSPHITQRKHSRIAISDSSEFQKHGLSFLRKSVMETRLLKRRTKLGARDKYRD